MINSLVLWHQFCDTLYLGWVSAGAVSINTDYSSPVLRCDPGARRPGIMIQVFTLQWRFQVWRLNADSKIRLFSALFGSTSITQVWPQEEEEAQFLVQESGPCVCGYPCVDDQCEGGECGRRRVSSEDQLTMKPHQNKLLQNLFQELTLTWIHFPALNY